MKKVLRALLTNQLGPKVRRRLAAWLNPPEAPDPWPDLLRQSGCLFEVAPRLTGAPSMLSRLSLGREAVFEPNVTIWLSPEAVDGGALKVGARAFVGLHTYLGVHAPITIGENALIGAYSYIISANHRYASRRVPIRDQGFTGAAIQIGADAWIGTHAVVLPGVSIGRGAIVGAGAIVTKNVPAYEIWGGVPARAIGLRPDDPGGDPAERTAEIGSQPLQMR